MVESEDELCFEPTLFLNENYEQRSLGFAGQQVELLCSTSATTDFDLTGQILWPAANLLSEYIANHHPEIVQTRTSACELGAGLGLVGILTARWLPVVLTDHSAIVLKVLKRNTALNQGSSQTRCMLLDWGSQEQIQEVKAASPLKQGFDLVLGADVAYGLGALPSLFQCAAALMAPGPTSLFLLGYVSRAAAIDRALCVEAAAAGLTLTEVPGTRRPVPTALEGAVYAARWAACL